MTWSSWSEFVAMGGYGLYVWASFGMCAVVVVVELALLALRRRAFRTDTHDVMVDARRSGA